MIGQPSTDVTMLTIIFLNVLLSIQSRNNTWDAVDGTCWSIGPDRTFSIHLSWLKIGPLIGLVDSQPRSFTVDSWKNISLPPKKETWTTQTCLGNLICSRANLTVEALASFVESLKGFQNVELFDKTSFHLGCGFKVIFVSFLPCYRLRVDLHKQKNSKFVGFSIDAEAKKLCLPFTWDFGMSTCHVPCSPPAPKSISMEAEKWMLEICDLKILQFPRSNFRRCCFQPRFKHQSLGRWTCSVSPALLRSYLWPRRLGS